MPRGPVAPYGVRGGRVRHPDPLAQGVRVQGEPAVGGPVEEVGGGGEVDGGQFPGSGQRVRVREGQEHHDRVQPAGRAGVGGVPGVQALRVVRVGAGQGARRRGERLVRGGGVHHGGRRECRHGGAHGRGAAQPGARRRTAGHRPVRHRENRPQPLRHRKARPRPSRRREIRSRPSRRPRTAPSPQKLTAESSQGELTRHGDLRETVHGTPHPDCGGLQSYALFIYTGRVRGRRIRSRAPPRITHGTSQLVGGLKMPSSSEQKRSGRDAGRSWTLDSDWKGSGETSMIGTLS